MFGKWTDELETIRETYQHGYPYKHVVIDGFFDDRTAETIADAIPESSESFEFTYDNPVEKKSVISDLARVPPIKDVFSALERNVPLFESVSGIDGLQYDAAIHGGGVHRIDNGGKLDLHLDYSMHPVTGKERRLNLIVFMSREWDEIWGGCLELWNANCTKRIKSIVPKFNRAVIFETGNTSWHGVPCPVHCPMGKTRDSIACYFVSDPTPSMDSTRQKAAFVPHPAQQLPPRLLKLYQERRERRLEEEDLWPGWGSDPIGKGYWY